MADEFRVSVKLPTAGNLDAKFRKKVNEIFNKNMLDAADELQRMSPVGATKQLKSGWDVIPAKRQSSSFETAVTITNNAPAAINRIVGRAPGKFPPDAPVRAWVKAKGIDEKRVFVIRRAIARKGTRRWRDKQNFAGFDLKGNPLPNSPVKKAEAKIQKELDQLNLENLLK